jgi:CubicO group peptidase (beta-lactamase class C family)
MDVGGTVQHGFEPVRDAFAAAQADDRGGAQLCIFRHGEIVVDLWAGRDVANDRPYTADTITILMSCTKAAVAVCAHMMAERGLLDLQAPVHRYWPQFAQNGKEQVRVAHLLSHSAGLFGFDPDSGIDARATLDWQACRHALEAMSPIWPPGSAYLYHFITYGVLVGEVLQRAAGMPIDAFFADEVAAPLKLDMWLGNLPERCESRVAPHIRSNVAFTAEQVTATFKAMGLDVTSRLVGTLIDTMVTTEGLIELLKTRAGRVAVVPAANALSNARSLAKMYAACIGEVDGIRLLSGAAIERARQPQTDHLNGPPPLTIRTGSPQRFGLGFELPRDSVPMAGLGSFGHPGAGGRYAFACPENGYAAAYVCNNLVWDGVNPDPRWGWNRALTKIIQA